VATIVFRKTKRLKPPKGRNERTHPKNRETGQGGGGGGGTDEQDGYHSPTIVTKMFIGGNAARGLGTGALSYFKKKKSCVKGKREIEK